MTAHVRLRDAMEGDVSAFFEHQLDAEANEMAAFTRGDPSDKAEFNAHWTKILNDDTTTIKTILVEGDVAGHVASFLRLDQLEVTYWLGKEHWGRGIATRALAMFLREMKTRPVFARAAEDNIASIRVLEKCGFTKSGRDRGFAAARGEDVDELIMKLA